MTSGYRRKESFKEMKFKKVLAGVLAATMVFTGGSFTNLGSLVPESVYAEDNNYSAVIQYNNANVVNHGEIKVTYGEKINLNTIVTRIAGKNVETKDTFVKWEATNKADGKLISSGSGMNFSVTVISDLVVKATIEQAYSDSTGTKYETIPLDLNVTSVKKSLNAVDVTSPIFNPVYADYNSAETVLTGSSLENTIKDKVVGFGGSWGFVDPTLKLKVGDNSVTVRYNLSDNSNAAYTAGTGWSTALSGEHYVDRIVTLHVDSYKHYIRAFNEESKNRDTLAVYEGSKPAGYDADTCVITLPFVTSKKNSLGSFDADVTIDANDYLQVVSKVVEPVAGSLQAGTVRIIVQANKVPAADDKKVTLTVRDSQGSGVSKSIDLWIYKAVTNNDILLPVNSTISWTSDNTKKVGDAVFGAGWEAKLENSGYSKDSKDFFNSLIKDNKPDTYPISGTFNAGTSKYVGVVADTATSTLNDTIADSRSLNDNIVISKAVLNRSAIASAISSALYISPEKIASYEAQKIPVGASADAIWLKDYNFGLEILTSDRQSGKIVVGNAASALGAQKGTYLVYVNPASADADAYANKDYYTFSPDAYGYYDLSYTVVKNSFELSLTDKNGKVLANNQMVQILGSDTYTLKGNVKYNTSDGKCPAGYKEKWSWIINGKVDENNTTDTYVVPSNINGTVECSVTLELKEGGTATQIENKDLKSTASVYVRHTSIKAYEYNVAGNGAITDYTSELSENTINKGDIKYLANTNREFNFRLLSTNGKNLNNVRVVTKYNGQEIAGTLYEKLSVGQQYYRVNYNPGLLDVQENPYEIWIEASCVNSTDPYNAKVATFKVVQDDVIISASELVGNKTTLQYGDKPTSASGDLSYSYKNNNTAYTDDVKAKLNEIVNKICNISIDSASDTIAYNANMTKDIKVNVKQSETNPNVKIANPGTFDKSVSIVPRTISFEFRSVSGDDVYNWVIGENHKEMLVPTYDVSEFAEGDTPEKVGLGKADGWDYEFASDKADFDKNNLVRESNLEVGKEYYVRAVENNKVNVYNVVSTPKKMKVSVKFLGIKSLKNSVVVKVGDTIDFADGTFYENNPTNSSYDKFLYGLKDSSVSGDASSDAVLTLDKNTGKATAVAVGEAKVIISVADASGNADKNYEPVEVSVTVSKNSKTYTEEEVEKIVASSDANKSNEEIEKASADAAKAIEDAKAAQEKAEAEAKAAQEKAEAEARAAEEAAKAAEEEAAKAAEEAAKAQAEAEAKAAEEAAKAAAEAAKAEEAAKAAEAAAKAAEEAAKPQKGDIVIVDQNIYKVVSVKKQTAAFMGTTNTNATKISINRNVVYKEVTFKVTQIAKNALRNNKTVKSVVMRNNITTIGKYAFSGCSKLKVVTIKSKKLTKVGKRAFGSVVKNVTFKVPSSKVSAYTKLLGSGIAPSGKKVVKY